MIVSLFIELTNDKSFGLLFVLYDTKELSALDSEFLILLKNAGLTLKWLRALPPLEAKRDYDFFFYSFGSATESLSKVLTFYILRLCPTY